MCEPSIVYHHENTCTNGVLYALEYKTSSLMSSCRKLNGYVGCKTEYIIQYTPFCLLPDKIQF